MPQITLPALWLAVRAAGFELIWFRIAVTILIEPGQITPPSCLNPRTIQATSGGRPISLIMQGSTPLVFIVLVMLVVPAVFSQFAMWLAT